MKSVVVLLCILSLPVLAVCQLPDKRQQPILGVHFILNDFASAQAIKKTSLATAFRNKQFGRLNDMAKGLGINYINGLTHHIDYMAQLTGSFPDYPYKDGTTAGKGHLLLELDASIRGKMLTSDHVIVPYLQAGIGGSLYQSTIGAILPAGMGLQVRILPDAYLLVNAQYRIGLTTRTSDHFFYGIGLAGSISKRKAPVKAKPVPVATPAPVFIDYDTDDDGVPDSVDACPQQKGLATLKGCPDIDGDGIADAADKCPYQAGLPRYQGCPIPDTDGDGIHDEADKCPTVKGPASNQGCPVVPATITEQVKRAAQQIQFATGSATLLPASFKALDTVVTLLRQDTLLLLSIAGHTDNTGQPAANQLLSEQRAAAVLTYINTKGIAASRITTQGYGHTQPVTTNTTAAGRYQNRRVVLTVQYP